VISSRSKKVGNRGKLHHDRPPLRPGEMMPYNKRIKGTNA